MKQMLVPSSNREENEISEGTREDWENYLRIIWAVNEMQKAEFPGFETTESLWSVRLWQQKKD